MSIFVDGNLEAVAGIFFHIYRLTPQVVLSAFAALAHGNEDDNRILAYLMPQLFATDPLVANSIVMTFFRNSSVGRLGTSIALGGVWAHPVWCVFSVIVTIALLQS